jgi:hypothetical protein
VCADARFVVARAVDGFPESTKATTEGEDSGITPRGQLARLRDAVFSELDRCQPEGALAALPFGQGVQAVVRFARSGARLKASILQMDPRVPAARACIERVLAEQVVPPPVDLQIAFELRVPWARY